jgi:hypothetical protein
MVRENGNQEGGACSTVTWSYLRYGRDKKRGMPNGGMIAIPQRSYFQCVSSAIDTKGRCTLSLRGTKLGRQTMGGSARS